jgi:hypothetical protein
MASKAETILRLTDHPMGREIADHVASGLSFGQILAKYDLSKKSLAKIHQYRSSIETALKMGTPVKEVISAHFTNPATAAGIMNVINQHKAGVA